MSPRSFTRCPPGPLSVALVALCGCRAAGQQPDAANWQLHSDPAGFAVRFPAGWSAHGSGGGRALMRSSDGRAFVLVEPLSSTEGGARVCLGRAVRAQSALFPAARIARVATVGASEAGARVDFAASGQSMRAAALTCTGAGGAMFYAVAAPTADYASLRPMLVAIARSFHYVASAGPPGRGGNDLAHISYVTWKDPIEGAFSLQVPGGWKTTGGLYRYAPVDVRPQVDTGTLDGAVHIQLGDANIATYAPPGPSSQMRGLREGQSYEVNGVPYTVYHYVDGAEYSERYVKSKLARQFPGLEVGESKDRPDLAEEANAKLPAAGAQARASVGETDFRFTRGGREMRGACYVRTEAVGQGTGGIWHAYPAVAVAPADQIDIANRVTKHMVDSFATDPAWSARATATAREFTTMVMQNHERAMAELRDIYNKFTQRMAENQRVWSNILNNQVDVRDPGTGQTFKADGGSNYYWRRGNTIVGSRTASAPDVNLTLLEQF